MAYQFPSYDPNAATQFDQNQEYNAWHGNNADNRQFPCNPDRQQESQNHLWNQQQWAPGPPQQQYYNHQPWQHINNNNNFQRNWNNNRRWNPRPNNRISRHAISNSVKSFDGSNNKKDDKTGSYSCEPCERMFSSEGDLLAHSKMHVECHFEGCKFTAAKKIVTLHFIKNHEEGKFRISLDTPEEIQKWIAERKRAFPTKENMERKRKNEEQKKEIGMTMKNKSFKYRNQQCIRCNGRNQKRGSRGRRGRGGKSRFGSDDSGCSCWRSGLSDNDYQLLLGSDGNGTTEKLKEEKAGGLGLLASYGSDDESSKSETDKEGETSKSELTERKPKQNIKQQQKMRPPKRKRKDQTQRDNPNNLTNRRRHGNLLEMLLANDIRHERNVILQCIRYVVNKNFFNESTPASV